MGPVTDSQLLDYKEASTFSFTAKPKKTSSIFGSMPKKYVFASGAGAWSTEIKLKKNGSFTGQYHDLNI